MLQAVVYFDDAPSSLLPCSTFPCRLPPRCWPGRRGLLERPAAVLGPPRALAPEPMAATVRLGSTAPVRWPGRRGRARPPRSGARPPRAAQTPSRPHL